MIIDTDKVVDDTYYDPETGKLFRVKELVTICEQNDIIRPRNIAFQKLRKQSTHVMFYIMTGRWPVAGNVIDHINGKPWDSRWENLREATPAQNMYNKWTTGKHLQEREREALYGEFAYKDARDVME